MYLKLIFLLLFFITPDTFSMQKKRSHNKLSRSCECIHSQEYTELQKEKHDTIAHADKAIGKKLFKFSNAPAPLFKVIPPKVLYPLEPESIPSFFEKNKNVIIMGGIGLGIGGAALIASHVPSSQPSKL
jgi:hypothetical protein